jgi:N-acyl-D-aspartate/D-glutamate deacylase
VTDLLVANGLVVDGTGAPASPGSVAISGDRIERVLPAGQPEPMAARRIEAEGWVVAPGFVDGHSHSDVTPFVEPGMDSMLRQGVTTLVVGNCGSSAFPMEGAAELAGLVGASRFDLATDWRSFGEYLERVEEGQPALNVAALIGHGTLRRAAMGEARRPPTGEELERMRALLAAAMEEGAIGLSTGLIYPPGLHATTQEIVEVALALEGRGVYTSHVRGEGETVFEAVAECIDVGRRAGVPAHVSHLKVESQPMWGRASELLALIDRAGAGGGGVTADQYPYTAWETELAAALPPWATTEELPAILDDPEARARLRDAVERGEPGWQSTGRGLGWDRIAIGAHLPQPELSGRSIARLCEERGLEPFEAIARLVLADPYTGMLGHGMHEDDVRTIVAREDVFVATDGIAVSPTGPLGSFAVHPRYYGTFPRILARYVREEGLLSIEAAVRKMTSLPADRFGLVGRGRIAEGAFADVVVFDPETVADRATYERPHAFAEGIDLVVVNGRIAWDGEARERAGRSLRRGRG